MVKHSVKEKKLHSGYGKVFERKSEFNFDNEFGRNVIIFYVDNSSSSHNNNGKNSFLVLGEGSPYGINERFSAPEKKFSINVSKAIANFCLSFYYNGDSSYLFVEGKLVFNFKGNNGNVNFPTLFCAGSISNKIGSNDSWEVSLKGNV